MRVAVIGASGRIGSLTVAALQREGHEVRHHVTLSTVPFTIVPSTQFHDFAVLVASWSENDGVALVPPLLIQPIAPADVAHVLARVAAGRPQGRHRDIAGPDPHDLVDMARRTHTALGRQVRLVPTWQNGVFDQSMAGDVLLPGPDAEIAPTSFDDWLTALGG